MGQPAQAVDAARIELAVLAVGLGFVLFVSPGVTRPLALFSALLGGLVATGLTAIGTGAFLLSKFGTQPKDLAWGPQPAAPLAAPLAAPPTGA